MFTPGYTHGPILSCLLSSILQFGTQCIMRDHLLFKRLGFVFWFFFCAECLHMCVSANWKTADIHPRCPDCFLPKDIYPASVSLLVRGTWRKSRNWSTRPSWCTAASSIWRSGRCQTAHWRTCSSAIKWPSWAAISCWRMRALGLLSWTTLR